MAKADGKRRRGAAIATAVVVGLTGVVSSERPADAKWQGCLSDGGYDHGHTARGYCYPWVDTRNLALYVKCTGDTGPSVAPFDREMDVKTPRGVMRMKAAEYKCHERKVIWHDVAPYA